MRRARHFQWDGRRAPVSAWAGVKVVVTSTETDASYGGRYVSLWLGPIYCGAGMVW